MTQDLIVGLLFAVLYALAKIYQALIEIRDKDKPNKGKY